MAREPLGRGQVCASALTPPRAPRSRLDGHSRWGVKSSTSNPSHSVALSIVTALIVLLISGCASTPAANPDRHFYRLRDIVAALPPGGTLDVFLVHGMRADSDQTYSDVIAAIGDRLPIEADIPQNQEQKLALVATGIPTVTLHGVSVFSAANWATFEPYLVIAPYHTKDDRHRINFYKLNYWLALATMKCLFIISPDTLVVGSSSRASYCASAPWNANVNTRLSGVSEWGNRWAKTEIMERGLADAVIATSEFRQILRSAINEALGIALKTALARDDIEEDVRDQRGETELSELQQRDRTLFVFITESLGSYILHDALNQDAASTNSHVEKIAPFIGICGATQVHMFANQLALPGFSELQVSTANTTNSGTARYATENAAGRSHFFRRCPNQGSTRTTNHGTEIGAQQVVVYHDPNYLLTYYTSDRPGYIGDENLDTTNVVAPFTSTIIPFLLTDPAKAHTGQASSDAIMDSVVCEHEPGNWKSCAPARP